MYNNVAIQLISTLNSNYLYGLKVMVIYLEPDEE